MGSIFLILAGIIIGTMVSSTPRSPATPSSASVPHLYNVEVLEIASHFLCSCGSCGETELASCTCPTAKQEKDFIMELIKKDYDKETIIKTVETMFGKKKA
jgi:hypothetical protein